MIASTDLQRASRIPEVIEDQLDPNAYDWIKKKLKEFGLYEIEEMTEMDVFRYYYFFALGVKYGRWHDAKWWNNI